MSFDFVIGSSAGELLRHCSWNQYPYHVWSENNFPDHSWYLIAINFFDHDKDLLAELSAGIQAHLRSGRIRLLFYYHEGDNPYRIKSRLDALCAKHALPVTCYRFVSGNTKADLIPGFVYFADHELLFQRQNHLIPPVEYHDQPRSYEFTALSRTHKLWRATVMSDLHRKGVLSNSLWSYGLDLGLDDDTLPMSMDVFPGLETHRQEFLAGGPYHCDDMDLDQQNNHALGVEHHYRESYCNIVLETFFDIEHNTGTFVSEKTFKPIKNAQPFVIAGPQGTLQCLRDLGYRTFDHAIDNSYDLESNHSQRWFKLITAVQKIQRQDLHAWYASCRDDILHNQQLFLHNKHDRLNNLANKLQK